MSIDAAETAPVALADDSYLDAKGVRDRYGGRSKMWLHRRRHGRDSERRLPPPDLEIDGRDYWRISTLIAWEKHIATLPSRRRDPPAKKKSIATTAVAALAIPAALAILLAAAPARAEPVSGGMQNTPSEITRRTLADRDVRERAAAHERSYSHHSSIRSRNRCSILRFDRRRKSPGMGIVALWRDQTPHPEKECAFPSANQKAKCDGEPASKPSRNPALPHTEPVAMKANFEQAKSP